MKNILLFSCITLATIFACENDMDDVRAYEERMNVKIETVKEVEILYSDSAQVRVRITAETMLNKLDRSEPHQEFIDGIFVEFFAPNGLVTSTMTANYAIRFEKKGQVIARDSVVWASIDGQKLETEELIWDEKGEEIFTHKYARITTQTEIIRGYGFRAKQDFSNARIQAVEGIISIDE